MHLKKRVGYWPDPQKKNFGFGRDLLHAGRHALLQARGSGRFNGGDTYIGRWDTAYDILAGLGVEDARDIDLAILEDMAQIIADQIDREEWSLDYGTNLLSTTNVMIKLLRGDRKVWISPAERLGSRDTIRTVCPDGLKSDQVRVAATEIGKKAPRAAAAVMLSRAFGLRLMEAHLLHVRRAHAEALKFDWIDVVEGTKGGRGHWIERHVPVGPIGIEALEMALSALDERDDCLVPVEETYLAAINHFYYVTRPILRAHGIASIRELRAAYACDRYRALTGAEAPAVAGGMPVDMELDRTARLVISKELGHCRIEILGSYCGGRRVRLIPC